MLEGIRGVRLVRQPVFQDEDRHSERIQKIRHLFPLGRENQLAKPAVRRDDQRATVRFPRWRPEHRERGIVNVLHPPVLRLLGLIPPGFKAGRTVLPERNDLRSLRAKWRNETVQQEGQEQARIRMRECGARLGTFEARLRLLGPEQVLARGYSITTDAATGEVLRAAAGVEVGRRLKTRLKAGDLFSRVEKP